MVVSDLIGTHADELEYFVKRFSEMSECNCSVMRIIAFDQHVTVKTSHFRNCEYTDSSEGFCGYRKDFALSNVSAQDVVSRALQTEECDVARMMSPSSVPFVTSIGRFLA